MRSLPFSSCTAAMLGTPRRDSKFEVWNQEFVFCQQCACASGVWVCGERRVLFSHELTNHIFVVKHFHTNNSLCLTYVYVWPVVYGSWQLSLADKWVSSDCSGNSHKVSLFSCRTGQWTSHFCTLRKLCLCQEDKCWPTKALLTV